MQNSQFIVGFRISRSAPICAGVRKIDASSENSGNSGKSRNSARFCISSGAIFAWRALKCVEIRLKIANFQPGAEFFGGSSKGHLNLMEFANF